jgi:hypothetical protein
MQSSDGPAVRGPTVVIDREGRLLFDIVTASNIQSNCLPDSFRLE